MKPATETLKGGVPAGVSPQVLAEAGEQYAAYLYRNEGTPEGTAAELRLELPAGRYRAEWLNTLTGAVEKPEAFDHAGGARVLASPTFGQDVALRVTGRK